MKTPVWVLMLVCALAISAAVASPTAIGGPPSGIVLTMGTYATKWTIPSPGAVMEETPSFSSDYADVRDDVRNEITAKPKFVSARPRFGSISFSCRPDIALQASLYFAVDESAGTGKGYDTLYLDVNRNKDLTDDPKATGKWRKVKCNCGDPYCDCAPDDVLEFVNAGTFQLSTLFRELNNSNVAAVDVSFKNTGEDFRGWLCVIRGTFAGEIDSSAGKIPFLLFDTFSSGRYSDPWRSSGAAGDIVLFDWTRTGRFAGWRQVRNWYAVKAPNSIAGKLYVLEPSTEGDSLQVTPYTGPTGSLSLAPLRVNGTSMKLTSSVISAATAFYAVPLDASAVDVPPGSYVVDKVTSTAAQGKNVWILNYDVSAPAIVKAGEKSTLKLPDKIALVIAPHKPVLEIERGIENFIPFGFAPPGGRPITVNVPGRVPGAMVTITNASGKVVSRGKAGFACGCSTGYTFGALKSLKPGKYRIEAVIQTSPFGKLRAVRNAVVK